MGNTDTKGARAPFLVSAWLACVRFFREGKMTK